MKLIAPILLVLMFLIHTSSLWKMETRALGSLYDPMAHAAMPGWYCKNVLTWNLHTDRYLAPVGVDLSTNFDSPFPLILTCPFTPLGSRVQFHFFGALQVALILLSAWLVARELFASSAWRLAYVMFAWWTGFYIFRVQEHLNLLSGLWGFQLLLWCALTVRFENRRNALTRGAAIGLVLAGSFHNVAMLTLPIVILVGFAYFQQRKGFANLLLAGVIATCLFGALFAPSIYAYLTRDLPRLASQRDYMNFDLLSFFLPWIDHPAYSWIALPKWDNLAHEKFNSVDALVWMGLALTLFHRGFWRNGFHRIILAIGIISLICSLGSNFEVNGVAVFPNPLEPLLRSLPPFSLSRSPARFATVTVLCLTFLAFALARAKWSNRTWFEKLGWSLVIWSIIVGPILNSRILMPTSDIDSWLPRTALSKIAAAPEDKLVAHIPSALMLDQTQNFLQLYHHHPITAGYVAYTAYDEPTLSKLAQDPVLGRLSCDTPSVPYNGDMQKLRDHLTHLKVGFIILNSASLTPTCTLLLSWFNELLQQPWLHRLETKGTYAVWEIDPLK